MMSRQSGTVGIAFELLLSSIDKAIYVVMERRLHAFEVSDFQQATNLSQCTNLLKKFRARVQGISQEWKEIAHELERRSSGNLAPVAQTDDQRPVHTGELTPRKAYYPLILKALEEMGGRGRMNPILDRVYALAKPMLNAADREPLKSDPRTPRWRRSAQWARYEMTRQGLLNPNSPYGIWEITEAGRAYLRQHGSGHSGGES